MKKEDIKIGKSVIYYHELPHRSAAPEPLKTVIRSEAWELCGSIVCKIEGIAGGVCITHLKEIS